MIIKKPLVIFDLETTGTWVEKDKIIEIAMIKIMPDTENTVHRYHSLVNPGIEISKEVEELTGIGTKDVKDSPKFEQIADDVLVFIKDSDLSGYNIERFDIPVLRKELESVGKTLNLTDVFIYDVNKIFKIKHKRNLEAAYQCYCKKDIKNAHTAMADTEATLEILKEQVFQYSDNGDISRLKDIQYEKQSSFFDNSGRARWWQDELYITFGKYNGKSLTSINKIDPGYLRWILKSEFSDDIKSVVNGVLDGKQPRRE